MVQDARYFPLPDGVPWEVVPPGAVGFDPTKLEPVVAAVSRSETSWPIEIRPYLEAGFFEPPPFNELLGPTEPRGRPNGLLSRGGRIVARWGDTRRVDMTFSVAKSYLSLIAGLAVMDGLIRDLDEPVGSTVKDGGNSFVEIGGRQLHSVPGGGHWGGGMFIHAEDQARLGLLMLRKGQWAGNVVLPESWIAASLTPCPLNPQYGYMWWLNTDRGCFAGASPDSFFALGSGGNIIWVDPANDIVAVLRWTDTVAANQFMAGVRGALLA